jgi:hypothetical protein
MKRIMSLGLRDGFENMRRELLISPWIERDGDAHELDIVLILLPFSFFHSFSSFSFTFSL